MTTVADAVVGVIQTPPMQPAARRAEVRRPIPLPLEAGDRLTRSEFERRYAAMPKNKAELIEGVVYMPTPVHASHSRARGQIMIWLGTYCTATPHVELHSNVTLRLDRDNEVQPDVLLRLDSACGGRSRITPDDYLEGAPELIVEVAGTSASYDLHDKLKVYRRNGIQEYLVWVVYEERLEWLRLSGDEYVSLDLDADGVIRSQAFPGLHLAVGALLAGDLAGVLAELQKGLQTPEHAAFVERLRNAMK